MEKRHRRWLQVLLPVVGAAGVVYGVVRESHPVFILGIVVGVAGYLLIRRDLKDSVRDREE